MVKYECDKCNKTFNKKQNYDIHKNRKKTCIIEAKYECNICSKRFTFSSSLYHHRNHTCKGPNESNSLIEKDSYMLDLEKKILELQNQMNVINPVRSGGGNGKTINNNQTVNNMNGDVKLVAFGKEDMSYISDEMYKGFMNRGFASVAKLIEHIHFNKDKPENHNVYISNLRSDNALVYDGIEWVVRDRAEVLDDLVSMKADRLEDKYDELNDGTMRKTLVDKFDRFLDRRYEDKIVNKMNKEVKLLLYNKRKMPESMRNV